MDMIAIDDPQGPQPGSGFLDGQMLIAMPTIRDAEFARTLIYLCAHSAEGAMGIVLNQPVENLPFAELLAQLNVVNDGARIMLPPSVERIQVLRGGPVETGRGFVLHSADYFVEDSTMPIHGGISLTATLDILRAIAAGHGPRDALLALGYAGWGPGQLEAEIQANGWLTSSAIPDLLFNDEIGLRYEQALRRLGIDPAMLSSEAGHA